MNKEDLEEFLNEYSDYTTCEQAILLNISPRKLRYWKSKYGLSKGRLPFMKNYKPPKKTLNYTTVEPIIWDNEEWFRKAYITENKTVTDIARIIKRDPVIVYRRLRKFNVPIKDDSWTKSDNKYCNEDWLMYHYADRQYYIEWCRFNDKPIDDGGLMLASISLSELAGVSEYTIYNWLAKFNIPLRSHVLAQSFNNSQEERSS